MSAIITTDYVYVADIIKNIENTFAEIPYAGDLTSSALLLHTIPINSNKGFFNTRAVVNGNTDDAYNQWHSYLANFVCARLSAKYSNSGLSAANSTISGSSVVSRNTIQDEFGNRVENSYTESDNAGSSSSSASGELTKSQLYYDTEAGKILKKYTSITFYGKQG